MIDTLPLLTPNASRGKRIVARCHERLERRRREIEAAQRKPSPRAIVIERAITGAFCAIYAATVILNALRVLFTA
jgi:hypothetical protein